MWDKRYPSIFDIFESFTKGFPFERKDKFEEDWFKEPFEDMIKRFEESMPAEFKTFVREEEKRRQAASHADTAPSSMASAILPSPARSPYSGSLATSSLHIEALSRARAASRSSM